MSFREAIKQGMSLEEKKRLIIALDALLRSKVPGSAADIAIRLGISRSSVFRLINYMRDELCAPIVFDTIQNRYKYDTEGMIMLRFVPYSVIDKSHADRLMGDIYQGIP